MKPEDRVCINCEAFRLFKVANPGSGTDKTDHSGLCECRQKLSDHYLHILGLNHVCAWHSDYLKDDKRYPNWRECIDLPNKS